MSFFLKKGVIPLSNIWKKSPILCVIFKKNQFFASNSRNLTVQFIATYSRKKGVQFFQSYFKMGSILWVRFLSRKMVQFFETFSKSGFSFYESCWTEGFNTVSHVEKNEGFNSLNHVEQKGSILWVMFERRVQFSESYFFEKLNSVNHVQKGFNYLTHFPKKSIL